LRPGRASPFELDLLRFTMAGSVDDGKSTLLGRLLYDTKSVLEDQLEQTTAASRKLGDAQLDLALLTDGLRAEREQRITIDVAYRFFATSRRKFIVADTPGHIQYTRNMVTGASTADLAVLLVDVVKGLSTQSRRHAVITSLLGIPQIIVAVNKMDLAGFEETAYDAVVREFVTFAEKLTIKNIVFVPMSALNGDNVVTASTNMPWYRGGPLLHQLETITVGGRANRIDFRFPVQFVIRPDRTFRGYAGTIASGSVRAGDEIVVLPSGHATRVKAIETFDGARPDAVAGDAVVLTTVDELDISRGDMIVRPGNLPTGAARVDAYLCWMDEEPLALNRSYLLRHTTRQLQAFVTRIRYRLDVDTLHREPVQTLGLNDVGRVEVTTGRPLFFDSYRTNMATGGFILIDPRSNATVAAGMIRGPASQRHWPNVTATAGGQEAPGDSNIPRSEREAVNAHRAAVVWLTGLSGAGKTTIARAVEKRLFDIGCCTMLLDGDQLRRGLCADLGFSPQDRGENIRRAGEVARLFFEQGCLVICAFVSPYRQDRDRVRALFPDGRFMEVFVHASLETCRRRDPKQLYTRAGAGQIPDFTGISAPYEEPVRPELTIDTERVSVEEGVQSIVANLRLAGLIDR
jgi:bifunctional enzyme CysN/CysC